MAKTTFSDTPPQGTIVTADFLNELNNQRHDGLDIDGHGALDYAVTSGAGNAYALTLSKPLLANVSGLPIQFKASFTNTGAATINISGLGAVAIKKNGTVALAAGDITAGKIYTIKHDGTNYQLVDGLFLGPADFTFFQGVSDGYQKLPSGLIIQWGYTITDATGNSIIAFPIEFPTACRSVVLQAMVTLSQHATFSTYTKALLAIQTWSTASGAGTGIISVFWMALGH